MKRHLGVSFGASFPAAQPLLGALGESAGLQLTPDSAAPRLPTWAVVPVYWRFTYCGGKPVAKWSWAGYRTFVILTAVLHLVGAMATAALGAPRDWPVPVYASFATWAPKDPAKGCFDTLEDGSVNVCTVRNQYKYVGQVSPVGMVVAFFALSFVFQMAPALNHGLWEWYIRLVLSGRQPLRFIEYSVSATLMVVIILVLNGAQDLWLYVAVAAANWCCMMFGLLQEELLHWRRLSDVSPPTGFAVLAAFAPHFCGWVPFAAVWVILITQFWWAIESADGRVPAAIYAIIFIQLFLFILFGATQSMGALAHALSNAKPAKSYTRFYVAGSVLLLAALLAGLGFGLGVVALSVAALVLGVTTLLVFVPLEAALRGWTYLHSEVTYTVLSLVAKQLLAWLLYVGATMRDPEKLVPAPPGCAA